MANRITHQLSPNGDRRQEINMKHPIKALTYSLLIVLGTPGAFAGHAEGTEVNVVVIECYVPVKQVEKTFKGEKYITTEPTKPPSVRVKALSFNATSAPIPTVSSNNSCAQALHEYLTAGFDLVRDVSLGQYVYMLTREDVSTSTH
jgi:hypothetical protein